MLHISWKNYNCISDEVNNSEKGFGIMLIVTIEKKPKIPLGKFLEMDEYTRLQDEREFTILIDNKVFYSQPLFPILELVEACLSWLQQVEGDFEYCTIEAEENPMLKFTRKPRGFSIASPWQEFLCTTEFTKEEVICFCEEIVSQVIDKRDDPSVRQGWGDKGTRKRFLSR